MYSDIMYEKFPGEGHFASVLAITGCDPHESTEVFYQLSQVEDFLCRKGCEQPMWDLAEVINNWVPSIPEGDTPGEKYPLQIAFLKKAKPIIVREGNKLRPSYVDPKIHFIVQSGLRSGEPVATIFVFLPPNQEAFL